MSCIAGCDSPTNMGPLSAATHSLRDKPQLHPICNAHRPRISSISSLVYVLLYSLLAMKPAWAFRAPTSLGRLQEVFPYEVGHGTLVCGSALRARAPVRCTYTAASATQHLPHRRRGLAFMRTNSGNGSFAAGELLATNEACNSAPHAIRKGFVGGNWKCNGTLEKVEELVEMLNAAPPTVESLDVIVAPPSLFACQVKSRLQRAMHVAAQDSSVVRSYGAFTGELSPKMLREAGIGWVVLGHSERRAGLGGAQPGESNELVAGKVKAALDEGLKTILCIGETLEQREKGETRTILSEQLKAVKEKVPEEERWNSIIIAYEPVWAIGTGRTATPQQAQDTHKDIRDWVRNNISPAAAAATRIIYGGSVKGSNAQDLYKGEDVDGFLVGGASLTKDFYAIIDAAASPKGAAAGDGASLPA